MKKQTIISILFLIIGLQLVTSQGNAQTYFNNEFSNDSSIYNNGSFVHPFADSSGYLVVGVVTIPGGTVYTRFLRLDELGDTLWAKLYGNSGVGQYTNVGNYVSIGDTNFVFTGTFSEETSGSSRTVLFKIDSSGNVLWDYRFGDQGMKTSPRDIKATPDGGYIITGNTTGWGNTNTGTSSFLLKLDSNGVEEWYKIYGGGLYRESYSVEVTADSGYIMSGRFYQSTATKEDINVVKTDVLGNLLWSKTYGTPERDNNFAYITKYGATDDYILVGGIDLASGVLVDIQGYIARINGLNGSVIWADTLDLISGGVSEAFSSNVIILPDGNIMGIGVTAFGVNDAWLVKYDGNGNILWQRLFNKYGGNSRHSFTDIHQTYDKGFVICGDLTNVTVPEQTLWVLKLDSNGCEMPNCTVSISENLEDNNPLLVSPNPSSGVVNFKLLKANNNKAAQLYLFDITGKEILSTSFNTNVKQIDVNTYPKGIYFYQLINGEARYSGKLIVQ